MSKSPYAIELLAKTFWLTIGLREPDEHGHVAYILHYKDFLNGTIEATQDAKPQLTLTFRDYIVTITGEHFYWLQVWLAQHDVFRLTEGGQGAIRCESESAEDVKTSIETITLTPREKKPA